MRNRMMIVLVTVLACGFNVRADVFGTGVNQFEIDFVPISGDAGDLFSWPMGAYTFTGVNRDNFRMGTFEITNAQWDKFKAEYGTVTGYPADAYDQSSRWTNPNMPTNRVSWIEAAQFVNWLNTSTGHHPAYKFLGTQGQGDYCWTTWSVDEADNGTNLFRHKDAFYYLPTEDEWVKAAYWNGSNLQSFATQDGIQPVEDVEANYGRGGFYRPWDVGSGSEELNGTFDMMGNVWEWMENLFGDAYSQRRVVRGGQYDYHSYYLRAEFRGGDDGPFTESPSIGFRVAADIPEPASLALLALGGVAVLRRRGEIYIRKYLINIHRHWKK